MKVSIRKGETTGWGVVEQYKEYIYGDRVALTLVTMIGSDGKLAEPYVFRGGEFVPAGEIEEQFGIERYLTAKKPFYCMLSDGFIVRMRISMFRGAGYTYDPEKSVFEVFTASSRDVSVNSGTLTLKPVLEVPDHVKELLEGIAKEVCEYGINRRDFLVSRCR